MEPIQIFKKAEEGNQAGWEFHVLLGHESKDVGFSVRIHQGHWEELTDGRVPPEELIKKTFRFLLKKQSKYSIQRSFDLRDISRHFPEYEQTIKKGRIGLGIFSL